MTHVVMRKAGRAGIISLERPEALNALDTAMVTDIGAALVACDEDPEVERVLLVSALPKAFCAGGDVRRIQQLAAGGHIAEAMAFFAAEYPVNRAIADFRKPYISLIDGICMGGGLGLSVHGRYRVVTERAVLAMPETLIGFFPDVGATYFLPRLPDAIGVYLGLTGMRAAAGDAVHVGLATHYVRADRLPELTHHLCVASGPVEDILAGFAQPPPSGPIESARSAIGRIFGRATLADISHALARETAPWCREALDALRRASPASLQITHDLFSLGAEMSLADCLDLELEYAEAVIQSPDFIEGVRAALIDKDQRPRWNPASARIVAERLARLRSASALGQGLCVRL